MRSASGEGKHASAMRTPSTQIADCDDGTICQLDISSSVGGGYQYCCPPNLKPCGGCVDEHRAAADISIRALVNASAHPAQSAGATLVSSRIVVMRPKIVHTVIAAKRASFGTVESVATVIYAARIFAARVPATVTQAIVARLGQRWVEGGKRLEGGGVSDASRCCDTSKICRRRGGLYGTTVEVCCSQSEHCTPDPRDPQHGWCCPAGQIWCQGSTFGHAASGKCCSSGLGLCCKQNEHCSNGHCCPTGYEWSQSTTHPGVGSCCPTGAGMVRRHSVR